ncbi:MAG TPA: nicotinate phosphoribosyltransferase [Nocardioidaceae bacterium]|nr:nicotinate phosphoribosyltransferase [Nocardioidaceae bacterium]
MHETGLLTDHYELTMVQAALRSSTASRRSVFELFARRLPDGRRYGVVAGTGRALDALESFGFSTADLDWLSDRKVVDDDTLEWLENYRFTGSIWGYGEGDVYFPGSPLLVVESTFAEAVVLETVLLSIYNHDSAVASAASRMTTAASGRPCIEMGSRRTHEHAAVAAARSAYIAGFSATSNLRAGIDHAIPTTGTAAHAFTLLHDTERDAFVAQVDSLGKGTTLLVDTYDIREAVGVAVEVAGRTLGAVRIDSGDLAALAHAVRRQLDDLGATDTSIIVTSDLDEFAIAGLAAAPVNGYGVGTSLVTGSGAPTSGFVYKLVSRAPSAEDGVPLVTVAKKSSDKTSIGGRKWALRKRTPEGIAEAEVIGIEQMPRDDGDDRPLLVPLVKDGAVVGRESLAAARDRHTSAMAELPPEARKLSRGEPAIPTDYLGDSRPASTAPFQQPSA